MASDMLNSLSALFPITNGLRKDLEKEVVPLSLPKNYMLLEAPKIEEHIYYLQAGFALAYHFEDGKKVVTQFWKPGQVIVSWPSFFDQVPATEFIQLMDKSELLCLSIAGFNRILEKRKNARVFLHDIMVRAVASSLLQTQDILRHTAVQRHDTLLKNHPELEQLLSQEHIASLLGITPQSLSRIKRRRDKLNK